MEYSCTISANILSQSIIYNVVANPKPRQTKHATHILRWIKPRFKNLEVGSVVAKLVLPSCNVAEKKSSC